ncbi:hypothetical protein QI155_03300 [Thermodesulfovibrio sp. 1176]|uniref:hypothetical protein n=1 Tax=Thermodesulfovibrio sp. 1176 TaxID=3043424 RepID=UPI002482B5D7|nr:hypothetical protein [Thermodesulfovibrio sp. 1176]MDI1471550.1 hypothetical protein [Thermodesulfovibrio sp. 1176]
MRKTFAVIAVVIGLAGLAFAADEKNLDYVCKVCYEPVPTDRAACETLVSNSLEGVQQMVISTVEEKQGVDRVIVECSFPQCTKKGYTGYKAVIDMKK